MEMTNDDPGRSLRRGIYLLLAITAIASAAGRIMAVRATTGETPMLSANDRSRWCTIAALVDHGTYEIDALVARRHTQTQRRHWHSIDLVRHRGYDGREHYYSSKPPLLPTLLAGQYWLIQKTLGLDIVKQPFYVMRLMLLLTNGFLLALLFLLIANLVESYGRTDWGRIGVFAVATWGTFLTTFAVTLNNHLPAAVSVLLAIWLASGIKQASQSSRWAFFGSGLAAGFAVANELPALAFLVLLAAWLYRLSAIKMLTGFVPGALLVAAAFFATNYLAHGTWKPAYAHRHDGQWLAEINGDAVRVVESNDGRQLEIDYDKLNQGLADYSIVIDSKAIIAATRIPNRWNLWDRKSQRRLALIQNEGQVDIREWGNWYEYAGSYWNNPQGIDRGEKSRLAYLLNSLVGHHGIFSLSPVWLLAFWGAICSLRVRRHELWPLACGALLLTVVCLGFYVARPLNDRNYGGISCGFRWLFWLIPIWTLCLIPALDRIASSRWARRVTWIALAVSVFSATYASMNPWSHPWIYDFWVFLGWLPG
jgi:hypothetical protein